MAENNLPIEVLDFVAGNDIEATISNIKRYKKVTEQLAEEYAKKIVLEKLGASQYVPPSSNELNSSTSMWS